MQTQRNKMYSVAKKAVKLLELLFPTFLKKKKSHQETNTFKLTK